MTKVMFRFSCVAGHSAEFEWNEDYGLVRLASSFLPEYSRTFHCSCFLSLVTLIYDSIQLLTPLSSDHLQNSKKCLIVRSASLIISDTIMLAASPSNCYNYFMQKTWRIWWRKLSMSQLISKRCNMRQVNICLRTSCNNAYSSLHIKQSFR